MICVSIIWISVLEWRHRLRMDISPPTNPLCSLCGHSSSMWLITSKRYDSFGRGYVLEHFVVGRVFSPFGPYQKHLWYAHLSRYKDKEKNDENIGDLSTLSMLCYVLKYVIKTICPAAVLSSSPSSLFGNPQVRELLGVSGSSTTASRTSISLMDPTRKSIKAKNILSSPSFSGLSSFTPFYMPPPLKESSSDLFEPFVPMTTSKAMVSFMSSQELLLDLYAFTTNCINQYADVWTLRVASIHRFSQGWSCTTSEQLCWKSPIMMSASRLWQPNPRYFSLGAFEPL